MARVEALTTGQLLDRVFSFYTKNFVLFFTIAAIPQFIYLAFLMVPAITTGSGVVARGSAAAIGLSFGFVIVGFIVHFATLAISQGATTAAVSDLYLGEPTSVGKCYSQTTPMAFRLMGLAVGYGLLVGLGFILLIVPGIYWAITYSLSTAVMAIERVSFSEAMSRSSDLVRGNRGRVALIYLLSIVATFVVAFGLAFPGDMLAVMIAKSSPVLSQIINLTVNTLAGALAAPIGLIGFTLAYYDARVRKEAFDLEYMMQTDAADATGLPAADSSAATSGQ